jgi:isochorismate hydrolase
VIDAYQRDLDVVVAADCVGSYDREHHDVTLRYLAKGLATVLSNDAIVARLGPLRALGDND